MIPVHVKRFDKSLPLPAYKTPGATGMDVYSAATVTIPPHQVAMIPLNIAVKIPEDCWLMVASRGSTHKLGIMMVNGFAIGDSDFQGDNDQYHYPALNFTDHDVTVEKGIRIAQIIAIRFERMEIMEVDTLASPDRGSFGSTGVK